MTGQAREWFTDEELASLSPQEQDWLWQRRWREDRDRRMAERQAEQQRLHAADPSSVPLYIPVDDAEFGTDAYTAGWEQEDRRGLVDLGQKPLRRQGCASNAS
jgi:hypothetical protein